MNSRQDIVLPDITTKTACGTSLVSTLVITPFVFNNFLQQRFMLGVATALVVLVCILNTWLCFKKQYHLWLNQFIIFPIITVVIGIAVYFLQVAGSYWVFLGIFALYFILPISQAWRANVIFSAIMFIVATISLEHDVLIRFTAVMIGASFYAYSSMREISKLYKQTCKQAIKDPLTDLYNRTLLTPTLEQAIAMHERTNNPMTLIMLDLDHFKRINDTYGHDTGDLVLQGIAQFLLSHLRACDMVFRIGGEEFLVLLQHTSEATGSKLAEKLRRQISELNLLPDKPVTASLGVVGLQKGMTRKQWLKECDQRVYCAKAKGRNRVCTQNSCPHDTIAEMG